MTRISQSTDFDWGQDGTGESSGLNADSLCIPPESFRQLATLITEEAGIQMPPSKLPLLQSRLLRRLRALNLHSIEEYRAYLFSSPGAEEKIHFIDAVTTNKTDFFREPQHFKFLQETAFPTLCGKQKGRALNIWSAGCSTGEECYSLAMVAREYGSARGGDFAVLATDISTRVLQHARHGIYEEARVLPVPAELRSKYVLRSKDRSQALVRIHPQLRSKISFHRLNLMDDDYGIRDTFDVVFFRNVMIYFDGPRKEHVIKCISRHLSPGGYLFIGHSESLSGLNVPVEPVGSAVFQKRHA